MTLLNESALNTCFVVYKSKNTRTHMLDENIEKSQYLVAKLIDDPSQRQRVEPRLGVTATAVHPRHHRQHDVEIAPDQVPRVPHAVLRPAADDVDQVSDLQTNGTKKKSKR